MTELFQHPRVIVEVLVVYWIFSAIVSGMPDPPPGSFFYLWAYHSLHALSGNLAKFAEPRIQALTNSTTTTVKVEETKAVPPDKKES